MTDSVTWSTSKEATATVSSTGLATGVATGAVTITATDPSTGIPGTAALTVTSAVLVSIAVTPPVASIAAGQTEQFTATGTYSDLSTQNVTNSVTWSTSKAATASISSTGLATGAGTGAVTITATDPSTGIPGTAALTVTPAVLVSIAVTPPVASIGDGQSEQFTATGTYSNLSTQNLTNSVTWSSSKAATASISSTGLATGVATGAVTITATDPSTGIPGTAALTVTPAVLVSIAVTPPVASIAAGQTRAVHGHRHLFQPEHPERDRQRHLVVVQGGHGHDLVRRSGHRRRLPERSPSRPPTRRPTSRERPL